MATRITDAAANAALDAIEALLDAGSGAATIKIYSGSQPAGPGSGVTGTLLAELTCSDPAAGSAASHVLTFSAITSDTNVNATGTAGWGRIADSDGNAVIDFSVSATGGTGDVTFDSVSFIAGGTAAISALTLTCPVTE